MELVTAISSAVMALVWVIYFQLFFKQYQRRRRPYLVIHHAQNEQIDALCLLVNMSEEAVHIQDVQVEIYLTGQRRQTFTITEYARVNPDDRNLQRILRQGPLQAGGYLVLGSFRNLILGRKSREEDARFSLQEVCEIEVRTTAIHGPTPYPIGVRRRFVLKSNPDDSVSVFPQNIHTEQLIRRKDRHIVRKWLEQSLKPREKGRFLTDQSDQAHQTSATAQSRSGET
ncbi:hypothetical protein [Thiomicrospira sp. WB1]|uniref:hypothetical protein n=1 Tax=Thiomicrospira sp. WB1 TaxID=1685380 RepID=UPI0007484D7B|nr:hypothetical protein [Thiomicrospira sp. WB1]KUJ73026.1 hypothetical protein AVO41_00320 [Thiomicrospira sp. WB1]